MRRRLAQSNVFIIGYNSLKLSDGEPKASPWPWSEAVSRSGSVVFAHDIGNDNRMSGIIRISWHGGTQWNPSLWILS